MKRARPKSKNAFLKKQAKLQKKNVYSSDIEESKNIEISDAYTYETEDIEESLVDFSVAKKADEKSELQDMEEYAPIIEEFNRRQEAAENALKKKASKLLVFIPVSLFQAKVPTRWQLRWQHELPPGRGSHYRP